MFTIFKETLVQKPIQILKFETIISSEKIITKTSVCKKRLLVHVSTKKENISVVSILYTITV